MLVSTTLIILIAPLRFRLPSSSELLQRLGLNVVKLVSAFSRSFDEPRCLQQAKMLRDSLARDADLMLHQQPSAELEECLAIPLTQLVQNHPSHRCSERFEDIGHLCAPQ